MSEDENVRGLDRDEVDDVVVRIEHSEGKDFDATLVELAFGNGPWLATDVVTATNNGVARVSALVEGAALPRGASRIRAKLPDGPRVPVIDAGTLYVT